MAKRQDRIENPILPNPEQRATMLRNGFKPCPFAGFVDSNGHRAYRSAQTGQVMFLQMMYNSFTGECTHSQPHYYGSWAEMISACMVEFSK